MTAEEKMIRDPGRRAAQGKPESNGKGATQALQGARHGRQGTYPRGV